jgi:hypothetical protein
MAANTAPIFSRLGAIEGGAVLTTQAADYTGVNINNQFIFDADEVSGSFIQRLRFKALGTNIATVARIYINNGNLNQTSAHVARAAAPSGAGSTTGGTLLAGNYFALVQPLDQYGGVPNAGQATSLSPESTVVTTTGTTSSINWTWGAVAGAASYRVFVGNIAGGQYAYFTTTTNSLLQTTATQLSGADIRVGNPQDYIQNQMFFGEISLPATTIVAAAATPDIDYPMNIALPPGYRILVGLGTTVAAGWAVTGIGGNY